MYEFIAHFYCFSTQDAKVFKRCLKANFFYVSIGIDETLRNVFDYTGSSIFFTAFNSTEIVIVSGTATLLTLELRI